MKLITSKNTVIILIISLFIACTTDEFCAEPTESLARLKFYSRVGSLLNDTTVPGFSVTGIIDYDSLLYDSVNTKSIDLPFSASANSSSFIMSFSIPDTLYVSDTIHTNTLLASINIKTWTHNNQKRVLEPVDTIVIDTIPNPYYLYDTISFFYSPVLYFISQACGFTYHYRVDSVQSTNNVIDTILINSDLITTKGNENFKVLL